VGVEAYGLDIKSQDGTPYLDWGVIYPGMQVNRTLYVGSISNVEITLVLNTTNWAPRSFSDYINLSWNCTEAHISPGEVFAVTLTLTVSDSQSFIDYLINNEVSDFSFEIIIRAQD